MLSVPFYDFPSSPLLIIGALGIVVALAVFFLAYQKYFNSPFNKELQKKEKIFIKRKARIKWKIAKNRSRFKKFIKLRKKFRNHF